MLGLLEGFVDEIDEGIEDDGDEVETVVGDIVDLVDGKIDGKFGIDNFPVGKTEG